MKLGKRHAITGRKAEHQAAREQKKVLGNETKSEPTQTQTTTEIRCVRDTKCQRTSESDAYKRRAEARTREKRNETEHKEREENTDKRLASKSKKPGDDTS